MSTANDILRIASAEVGYSRWTDPQQGTKYGRWFAAKTGSTYYAANGVPYCAMFVSWVFAQAGQTVAGLPHAYCPTILNTARKAGLILANKKDARAGDIVLFDWDGGLVDHIGIIEKNYGNYLQTIEGNTSSGTAGSQGNGGLVARRTRAWNVVNAIIRPQYTGATSSKVEQVGALAIDGSLGTQSIIRLQNVLGTYADGVISGQAQTNKKYTPALHSVTYEGGGSQAIRALQKHLAVTTDGHLGRQTITAWQKRLQVTADGSLGPATARTIQTRLNTGKLF